MASMGGGSSSSSSSSAAGARRSFESDGSKKINVRKDLDKRDRKHTSYDKSMKSIKRGIVAKRAAEIESGSSEPAEYGDGEYDSESDDEVEDEDEDVPSPKSKTLKVKEHTSPVEQGRVSQKHEQFSNKPKPPAQTKTPRRDEARELGYHDLVMSDQSSSEESGGAESQLSEGGYGDGEDDEDVEDEDESSDEEPASKKRKTKAY